MAGPTKEAQKKYLLFQVKKRETKLAIVKAVVPTRENKVDVISAEDKKKPRDNKLFHPATRVVIDGTNRGRPLLLGRDTVENYTLRFGTRGSGIAFPPECLDHTEESFMHEVYDLMIRQPIKKKTFKS